MNGGTGTLTLNNANSSYAGSAAPTTDITGNVTLTGGHTLNIGSGTGTIAKLGIGGALTLNNATLNIDFANGGSTYDQITVGSLIASSGTNTINLVFTAALGTGQYTLINGASAGSINLANLTLLGIASERANLSSDGTSLFLDVTFGVQNLTWTGAAGETWNNTSTNKPWTSANSSVGVTAFLTGDNVYFDGTAAEKNISLTAAVAPASITVSGTETQTLTNTATGKITGGGTLTKQDSGTLILTNGPDGLVNDFTGAVSLAGGIVELTGSGALLANGGAASALGASTKAAANLALSGGVTLKLNGAKTSNITDRSFTLGDGGATLEAASASLTFFNDPGAIAHTGTADRTLTLTGVSGATHIENGYGELNGGAIALQLTDPSGGKLRVVKEGTGIWSLQGNNTFTGGVAINGGMLLASSDTSFGAAPGTYTADAITLSNGAAIFNGSSSTTSLFGASATYTISANRGITLGAGGGGLRLWGDSTLTIDSVITGAGALRKWDTGTLVLNGVNTFAGDLTLDAGTLQVGVGAIPYGADKGGLIINGNSVLALAGDSGAKDFYVNSLTGTSGTLHNTAATTGAHTLHIGFGTTDVSFGGLIENGGGTLGITKAGTGTLTLSGANTYTGNILVEAGILKAGSAGALGASTSLTVQTGATLDLNGVSLDNTKTLTLGGTGTTSQGALTSTATTALSVDQIVLSADASISTAGTMALGAITTGSGSTHLTLGGTAGYTAATADGININGKVILNTALTVLATNALAATGQIDLGATGGLLLDGSVSQQLTALNGAVGSTIAHTDTAGTATLTIANTATNTIASVIGGATAQTAALNLNKTGSGTLILENAASTYTGITSLTGGTVQLSAELSSGATGVLGATSVVAADHLVIDGTILHSLYSGTSATNRLFTIGAGGASLIADNGALQFNGTGAIAFTSAATDVTLTLGGDASGSILASSLGNTASGTTSLVKTGSGSWTLSGANTYTGTTDLQAGSITLGADQALGTSALTLGTGTTLTLDGHSQTLTGLSSADTTASIINGSSTAATLTVNTAVDQTYAGSLGDGSANGDNFAFTKGGTGTLTLTGSATYTGDTTVAGGTLHYNYSGADILGANITVYDTATLNIANLTLGAGRTLTAGTSGSTTGFIGNLTLGADAILDISGSANTGRVLNINGDLTLQAGSTLTYSFTGNLAGDNSQVNANHLGIGGEIWLTPVFVDNTLALGTYVIANYATFTGSTDDIVLSYIDPRYRITFTADSGQIAMDVLSNSSDTPVYWTGAANSGTPASPIYQWGGSGPASQNFIETGSTDPHTFIAGEHAIFGDDNIGGRDITVVTNGVYIGSATFDSDADYTVSGGELKGAGYLVKQGTGTLTLNSANAYSGALQNDGTYSAGTVLAEGTIVIGHQQALGTGQLLFHGGTLTTSSALPDIANAIAVSDKATGTLQVDYATTLTGDLTGSGTLRKTGTEALRLTGDASNFRGRIDHTGGALQITQGDYSRAVIALSGSSASLLLDLTGDATVQLGSLSGVAGTLVTASAGNKTLELGNASGSSTYAGDIIEQAGSTIAITKTGQSTITLGGNNAYTGDTTVREGTLQISGTFNPTNQINIESAGTFALNQTADQTLDTAIVNAGTFDKRGENTLTLTVDNTAMSGTVRITDGTLALANGATLGTAAIVNNGTLAYTTDGDTTIVSTISGSGDIRKQGTGTFTYLGHNTSTGTTYVEVDTLVIGDTNPSGNQTYKSAKIDLANTDVILNAGTGNTLSMGGGFTGTGTVNKEGDGVVTLAGRTTFAGTIHVNAGELHIGVGSANGTLENPASEISLAAGTKLVFNRGNVVTIQGTLSGSGTVENRGGNTGDGTIILAAQNNLTGDIYVTNRSTLQIGTGADSTARLADDNTDISVNLAAGATLAYNKIGRASCRERVSKWV
jgi:autotransporter-associated beta strand protein